MCLLSLGFTSCHKDDNKDNGKANEKFIGNYAGSVTVTGQAEVTFMGMTQTVPMDPQSAVLTFQLTAGDNDDQVIAKLDLDGQIFNTKGTCKDNEVTFDDVKETINLEETKIDFNLTNFKGNLDGNDLKLTGDIDAQGPIVVEEMSLDAKITGALSGTLARK